MIVMDYTTVSVVIVCKACAVWHSFAFTKLEAWERAAAHEERAHPNEFQARKAYEKCRAKARHAE